ncbi:terminase [Rhodococcus pyridinivorans]|uniref:terminase n=1 Tax=Rhodococcus pyridinivorans TaxID=103816 RepID=UPI00215ADA01|nr:terminase [Rhodococcus pyridinivorans]MCR8695587.1 terminase [Rhodococcus pyridinivorans]MCZ4649496.1 terminase [Rhodococcus pyridinivorans]
MVGASEFVVDFPTLGDLADGWMKQHCRVPDGFQRGRSFEMADWQFWCAANHYRVRADAVWRPEQPLMNQAFTYRRSQIVAPQKTGKGPWSAAIVAYEAVGPCLFGGWAESGDGYACSDFGCSCGWEYEYLPGEPMGIRHPSPIIQLTATSEDQVANVYRPLTAMIKLGPLSDLLYVREGFIRIAGDMGGDDFDRIDVVTASANSRLGNPVSFVLQDETGLYTKTNKMVNVAQTQRRGAAGMGGRSIETTNCWDPSENSTAQMTYEAQAQDIFKFYRKPPADLSYRNKRERRKIHAYVYEGSWWVDLDSIEAEAAELLETDPAQAERFFGNRLVYGQGAWLRDGLWEERYAAAVAAES